MIVHCNKIKLINQLQTLSIVLLIVSFHHFKHQRNTENGRQVFVLVDHNVTFTFKVKGWGYNENELKSGYLAKY